MLGLNEGVEIYSMFENMYAFMNC